MDSQIKKLSRHFIVCGYGRVGRLLTQYLIQKYIDVVVIERDKNCVDDMNEDGVLYLIGDAGNEEVLLNAGIKRAKGVIAVIATDAENVFLVLLAKQLNPDVFIVTRASQESAKKTLAAAGADKVISPFDIGARRMAHAILRPTVIQFLEMAFTDEQSDIQIEEIVIKPASRLAGVALVDSGIRKEMNLIILAIKKKQGQMVFNPRADTKFEPGDTVVVMGKAKHLGQLEIMLHT